MKRQTINYFIVSNGHHLKLMVIVVFDFEFFKQVFKQKTTTSTTIHHHILMIAVLLIPWSPRTCHNIVCTHVYHMFINQTVIIAPLMMMRSRRGGEEKIGLHRVRKNRYTKIYRECVRRVNNNIHK